MDIEKTHTILGICSIICAGLIFVVYRWIRPWLKQNKIKREEKERSAVLQLKEDREFREKIDTIFDRVNNIDKQLRPNSGKTVFDKVDQLLIGYRRVEQKLNEYQDRQKFQLNMENVAFCTADEKGTFDYVSPAFCKMVKRTESEMIKLSWLSWISKNKKREIMSAWRQSIDDGRAFDETIPFVDNDENIINVTAIGFHSYDKTDNIYVSSYVTFELCEVLAH